MCLLYVLISYKSFIYIVRKEWKINDFLYSVHKLKHTGYRRNDTLFKTHDDSIFVLLLV